MNDISTAPKDGSRILLWYHVRHYVWGEYRSAGTKWEECRWIDDTDRAGSAPHWEPWCGTSRTSTTQHINPEHAIAWLPLPQ